MPRASSRRRAAPHRRWWPLALFALAFVLALGVYLALFAPLNLPAHGYRLVVKPGSGLRDVVTELQQREILRSSLPLRAWARIRPSAGQIRSGVYQLRAPLSPWGLLKKLGSGQGPLNRITVIEGTTFSELREQIAYTEGVRQTLTGLSDHEVLTRIGATETHPEGLFAPDTYDLGANPTDLDLLQRLYRQQQKVLDAAWAQRASNLPYRDPYQALIMASIVEKETGVAEERPQIAGVFVRRLQQGMRLQTDPTVIYGLGERFDGNLTRQHLRTLTPYNTYRINGLPPTPIALPGRAAIEAALHPAPGGALYFVARGDGSHVFSATLAEHNRAVSVFQKNRRED